MAPPRRIRTATHVSPMLGRTLLGLHRSRHACAGSCRVQACEAGALETVQARQMHSAGQTGAQMQKDRRTAWRASSCKERKGVSVRVGHSRETVRHSGGTGVWVLCSG